MRTMPHKESRCVVRITAFKKQTVQGSRPLSLSSESLHGIAELGDHPLDLVVGHVLGGADGVGQADGVPRRPRPHPHPPVHPHGDLELEALAEGGEKGALGREQLPHEVKRNRKDETAARELPQAGLGRGGGIRFYLFLPGCIEGKVI